MFAQLGIHAVGGGTHGQLAQGRQIALDEEGGQGARGLLLRIDLALLHALDELVGRQVDQFDVVRHFHDAVGHRFTHTDAGDACDRFVQCLDVLDIERGIDVDTGCEDLFHVLPALLMTTPVDIGMRELIDQRELRVARQERIEVQLRQDAAAIDHGLSRQLRQPRQLRLRFGAPVCLDQRGNDIDAVGMLAVGILKHRPGLADAGRGADENLQPAPALALRMGKQCVGRGPDLGVGRHSVAPPSAPAGGIGKALSSARFVTSTFTRGSP